MRKIIASSVAIASGVAMAMGVGASAYADDEKSSGFTFSANTTFATDYRFRGISQTENDFTIQGGFDVSHEDGFYAGAWASNLSGWGTFGGSNTELDLYGGYQTELDGIAFDVGAVYYVFPQGSSRTSYAEIYGSVGKSFEGVDLSVGANYAFKQDSLSLNDVKQDNLYVYADAGYEIPSTPFSIAAHFGYSDGNPGAGPNGWVPSPTGTYVDWSVGVSAALPWGPLSASVTYVDTDISRTEAAEYQLVNPGYRFGIGDATGVFALSASF